MTSELLARAKAIAAELQRRQAHRKILTYYPETGPFRRELYRKHQEFFTAGATFRQRLMLAANRVGKTEGVGGYEVALHLSGWYPEWWKGRRFDKPIAGWAAGDTGKTVKEIIQHKLLGPVGDWGSGLLPGETIAKITRGSGVADQVDTIYVRNTKLGLGDRAINTITLKSYDQRRLSFQGTERDFIWLDEEPPLDIYTECLLRTMTNNGVVLLTFTPLSGMSDVVLQFLPGGKLQEKHDEATSKFVVMATWDDAPHLTEEVKAELWREIPPYQRDARSKGIPQLGSGAIYPVPESEITCAPFPIPDHWPRGNGMDVGWNWTAVPFMAHDRDTDTVYVYHVYKKGQAEPSTHVHGIQAPGKWIPNFCDPAANGRSQRDGEKLLDDYRALGLNVSTANNTVEAGLYRLWQRMAAGRFKVFANCAPWFEEFRLYRRDDKGHVVKANDHLMDGTRYGESRLDQFTTKPATESRNSSDAEYNPYGAAGWTA